MRRLMFVLVFLVALGGAVRVNPAGASDGCDKFGCSQIGPITPWNGLAHWNQDHLPVAGCRWLAESSRGIYPVALQPALTFPLPLKWVTSYTFHARVYWCWTADGWTQNQYGDIDWTTIANPHISKFKVQTWWTDQASVTSNEHVIQVQSRYHPCTIGIQPSVARGCLTIKITGEANISIPPALKTGGGTAHPRVTFYDLGADGSYTGTSHDHTPL